MNRNEPTAGDEMIKILKTNIRKYIQWITPSPEDVLPLQVLKIILKIPVTLFIILASPVLLVILVIIFVVTF